MSSGRTGFAPKVPAGISPESYAAYFCAMASAVSSVRNVGSLPSRVVAVEAEARRGVYAPLTAAGNLVVDGVLASCYALVDSQAVAHAAFAPVRWWEGAKQSFNSIGESTPKVLAGDSKPKEQFVGVHWYAKWLYGLGELLLPSHLHDS